MDSLRDARDDGVPDGGAEMDGESFVEYFDITVGEVLVTDEDSDERRWLWKASTEDVSDASASGPGGAEALGGTMFDAVMGCIEEITGGDV